MASTEQGQGAQTWAACISPRGNLQREAQRHIMPEPSVSRIRREAPHNNSLKPSPAVPASPSLTLCAPSSFGVSTFACERAA